MRNRSFIASIARCFVITTVILAVLAISSTGCGKESAEDEPATGEEIVVNHE